MSIRTMRLKLIKTLKIPKAQHAAVRLWMILPIALEVLSFTFLIMTIVQCNMSGVAIWKSSTLPILQGKVQDLQESFEQRRR